MSGKIVDRYLHILIPEQAIDFLVGQIEIERVGRIEIVVGGIFVVLLPKNG